MNFCNNCGRFGHYYHQCKKPIISIGIILFRYNKMGEREYLIIRRKNTLGYVDFIRGKYPICQEFYLKNIISEMTSYEKTKLKSWSFDKLWNDLWGENSNNYNNEEKHSRNKFKIINEGIQIKDKYFSLKALIDQSPEIWYEPEWGFPKGRRNHMERDINCALREFEEECGYSRKDIHILKNVVPYEETFIGSNIKCYKHKYFLAYTNCKKTQITDNFQKSEVGKMQWASYEDCLRLFRYYNIEKINILTKIETTLNMFKTIITCYT